jgi:hypothetical protein
MQEGQGVEEEEMKPSLINEDNEMGYIRSVNMDICYSVSPEAGNISHLLCEDNESDNWFVTVYWKRTFRPGVKNKRERKI